MTTKTLLALGLGAAAEEVGAAFLAEIYIAHHLVELRLGEPDREVGDHRAGTAVVRALTAGGHHVVGLARSQARTAALLGVPVEWVWGNLRDPASYQHAAASCDAPILSPTISRPIVPPYDPAVLRRA